MPVRVYVECKNAIEVQHYLHGAGWVEKPNGSLSVINSAGQELACFKRWDWVQTAE